MESSPKQNYWTKPKEKVIDQLRSSINGLSQKEATARLKLYGLNELAKKKKENCNNCFFI